jgi:hypothetical protein
MRDVSIKHCLDLVVKGGIVEVLDFDGLEVLLGIEVPLRDEEALPQN